MIDLSPGSTPNTGFSVISTFLAITQASEQGLASRPLRWTEDRVGNPGTPFLKTRLGNISHGLAAPDSPWRRSARQGKAPIRRGSIHDSASSDLTGLGIVRHGKPAQGKDALIFCCGWARRCLVRRDGIRLCIARQGILALISLVGLSMSSQRSARHRWAQLDLAGRGLVGHCEVTQGVYEDSNGNTEID